MKYYHLFRKLKGYNWEIHDDKDQILFDEITKLYNTEEWQETMEHFIRVNMNYKRKFLITKNAYSLSLKIRQDIDRLVFPIIEISHNGSMHNSEGFATWRMYQSNMQIVGSNQPTKQFLLKKNTIVETEGDGLNSFLYAQ